MREAAILIVAYFICVSPAFAYDWAANPGDGSVQNPYRISTAEQLNSIGNDANLLPKCFVLDNDIDLQAYAPDKFNIIGDSWNYMFTGTFDGKGHGIRNFTWSGLRGSVGIFGFLGHGGTIKNVGVADVNIDAGDGCYIGGLAGRNDNGTIKDCFVTGTIRGNQECGGIIGFISGTWPDRATISNCRFEGTVIGRSMVGGIAGSSDMCTIKRCESICSISGESQCGGIAGRNLGGDLIQCFAQGTIGATGSRVGGLAGWSGDHCTYGGNISQCGVIVDVSGGDYVGGLVGDLRGSRFLVTNCYAQGTAISQGYVGGFGGAIVLGNNRLSNCYCAVEVSGADSAKAGGFAGDLLYGAISCFWDVEISGQTSGAAKGTTSGLTGCSTAEMLMQSTYCNAPANWDFVNETQNGSSDFWYVCTGEYPSLWWQNPLAGDLDYNKHITKTDLSIFCSEWLSSTEPGIRLKADIDSSGIVDFYDFSLFAAGWGE